MNLSCLTLEITDHNSPYPLNRPDKPNPMTPAFWKQLPLTQRQISNGARAPGDVISSEASTSPSAMVYFVSS